MYKVPSPLRVFARSTWSNKDENSKPNNNEKNY